MSAEEKPDPKPGEKPDEKLSKMDKLKPATADPKAPVDPKAAADPQAGPDPKVPADPSSLPDPRISDIMVRRRPAPGS